MVGARVNGKLVTIDYEIKNGDRIEVITSQNSKGPSRDWLKLAKSTQAKNKINQWFKSEFKEENITRGRDLIYSYAKSHNIVMADLLKPEFMEATTRKFGFRDWESVYAAVGHGGLKEGQVVSRLQEEYNKSQKVKLTDELVKEQITADKVSKNSAVIKSKSGIVVKGLNDVAVRFSKCCSPVPGDEIVGFVTRGRGVSIHRTDCVNVMNLPEEDRVRMIEAEWSSMAKQDELYSAEIVVYANNRTGMLVDITKSFTENKIDVKSMNVRTSKKGTATITVGFEIRGVEQLRGIVKKLREVEGVLDIERTSN